MIFSKTKLRICILLMISFNILSCSSSPEKVQHNSELTLQDQKSNRKPTNFSENDLNQIYGEYNSTTERNNVNVKISKSIPDSFKNYSITVDVTDGREYSSNGKWTANASDIGVLDSSEGLTLMMLGRDKQFLSSLYNPAVLILISNDNFKTCRLWVGSPGFSIVDFSFRENGLPNTTVKFDHGGAWYPVLTKSQN